MAELRIHDQSSIYFKSIRTGHTPKDINVKTPDRSGTLITDTTLRDILNSGANISNTQILKPDIRETPLEHPEAYAKLLPIATYRTNDTFVGEHQATEWVASLNEDFSTILDSTGDPIYKDGWYPAIDTASTKIYVKYRFISNDVASPYSDSLEFTTPEGFVAIPSLSVIEDGATPLLKGSPFKLVGNLTGVNHTASSWSIIRESDNKVIKTLTMDTTKLTEWKVETGLLEPNTAYKVTLVYHTDHPVFSKTRIAIGTYKTPASAIETPTLTFSSADGKFVVNGTPFNVISGTDEHVFTSWIVRNSTSALVFSEPKSKELTSINLTGVLEPDNGYTIECTYKGSKSTSNTARLEFRTPSNANINLTKEITLKMLENGDLELTMAPFTQPVQENMLYLTWTLQDFNKKQAVEVRLDKDLDDKYGKELKYTIPASSVKRYLGAATTVDEDGSKYIEFSAKGRVVGEKSIANYSTILPLKVKLTIEKVGNWEVVDSTDMRVPELKAPLAAVNGTNYANRTSAIESGFSYGTYWTKSESDMSRLKQASLSTFNILDNDAYAIWDIYQGYNNSGEVRYGTEPSYRYVYSGLRPDGTNNRIDTFKLPARLEDNTEYKVKVTYVYKDFGVYSVPETFTFNTSDIYYKVTSLNVDTSSGKPVATIERNNNQAGMTFGNTSWYLYEQNGTKVWSSENNSANTTSITIDYSSFDPDKKYRVGAIVYGPDGVKHSPERQSDLFSTVPPRPLSMYLFNLHMLADKITTPYLGFEFKTFNGEKFDYIWKYLTTFTIRGELTLLPSDARFRDRNLSIEDRKSLIKTKVRKDFIGNKLDLYLNGSKEFTFSATINKEEMQKRDYRTTIWMELDIPEYKEYIKDIVGLLDIDFIVHNLVFNYVTGPKRIEMKPSEDSYNGYGTPPNIVSSDITVIKNGVAYGWKMWVPYYNLPASVSSTDYEPQPPRAVEGFDKAYTYGSMTNQNPDKGRQFWYYSPYKEYNGTASYTYNKQNRNSLTDNIIPTYIGILKGKNNSYDKQTIRTTFDGLLKLDSDINVTPYTTEGSELKYKLWYMQDEIPRVIKKVLTYDELLGLEQALIGHLEAAVKTTDGTGTLELESVTDFFKTQDLFNPATQIKSVFGNIKIDRLTSQRYRTIMHFSAKAAYLNEKSISLVTVEDAKQFVAPSMLIDNCGSFMMKALAGRMLNNGVDISYCGTVYTKLGVCSDEDYLAILQDYGYRYGIYNTDTPVIDKKALLGMAILSPYYTGGVNVKVRDADADLGGEPRYSVTSSYLANCQIKELYPFPFKYNSTPEGTDPWYEDKSNYGMRNGKLTDNNSLNYVASNYAFDVTIPKLDTSGLIVNTTIVLTEATAQAFLDKYAKQSEDYRTEVYDNAYNSTVESRANGKKYVPLILGLSNTLHGCQLYDNTRYYSNGIYSSCGCVAIPSALRIRGRAKYGFGEIEFIRDDESYYTDDFSKNRDQYKYPYMQFSMNMKTVDDLNTMTGFYFTVKDSEDRHFSRDIVNYLTERGITSGYNTIDKWYIYNWKGYTIVLPNKRLITNTGSNTAVIKFIRDILDGRTITDKSYKLRLGNLGASDVIDNLYPILLQDLHAGVPNESMLDMVRRTKYLPNDLFQGFGEEFLTSFPESEAESLYNEIVTTAYGTVEFSKSSKNGYKFKKWETSLASPHGYYIAFISLYNMHQASLFGHFRAEDWFKSGTYATQPMYVEDHL
nr:MAG TPA: hypothetical protein [Caudoviricetes sp.]